MGVLLKCERKNPRKHKENGWKSLGKKIPERSEVVQLLGIRGRVWGKP